VTRRAHDSANAPPARLWLWMLPMWWFFLYIAYHFVLAHRLHVYGALPYLLLLGFATVPVVYLLVRRHRRREHVR